MNEARHIEVLTRFRKCLCRARPQYAQPSSFFFVHDNANLTQSISSVSRRHSAPTVGVMVWGAIVYNTRSPPVFIRGTMIAQQYVHDILQPHVLPLMQRLSGAIS
ncbi:transposable element Tcb2 transposase [Trichonephila clavipes]|nr:transposable element Tcb2 transposase [Trichonephila clavipes]